MAATFFKQLSLSRWNKNSNTVRDGESQETPLLLGRISDVASDLTKLEVNTILKPTISGEKMPKSRHALINIAQSFCDALGEMDLLYPPPDTLFKGSYAIYHGLREKAKANIQKYEPDRVPKGGAATPPGLSDRDLFLLYRIRDLSALVHGIMTGVLRRLEAEHGLELPAERREALLQGRMPEAGAGLDADAATFLRLKKLAYNDYTRDELVAHYPPYNLAPDELTTLRKIWEIGTEEIAMQTVIQLDGDVITRVTPRHITQSDQDKILQRIHGESVGVSMSYWGTLVQVASGFFEMLVDGKPKGA